MNKKQIRTHVLALCFACAFLLGSTSLVEAVTTTTTPVTAVTAITKAKAAVKAPAKFAQKKALVVYASSSDQILDYLRKRPGYSTSSKDLIIKNTSTSSYMSLMDPAVYPIQQLRNGLYEETGQFYNGVCDNENYNTYPLTTQAKYSLDTKTKVISTTFFATTSPLSVTLPYPFVSYMNFATSSNITDLQKSQNKNLYFYDDGAGHTYGMFLDVYKYSPFCAKYVMDRIVFQSESIVGFSYGIAQALPVGGQSFQIRGKKTIKGNDVRAMYYYMDDGYKSNIPVFTTSPFEGSNEKWVDGSKTVYYSFRIDDKIYSVSIFSDNSTLHTFADQLITKFFR